MIDVQIVAGKRPEVFQESIRRLLQQDAPISKVFVANCTGADLGKDEDFFAVGVDEPRTFEQNHNALAKLGSAPFVLMLDDDAFLFDGALQTLLSKIQSEKDVAAVGGVNNQTFPAPGIPSIGSLSEFKDLEALCDGVAATLAQAQNGIWASRIFLPGNCLLVRRRVWQREYGGWDEAYRNWSEEVDFTAWCFERGYRALCTPSVWFYHCQGQSRTSEGLRADIAASSRRFAEKWPRARVSGLESVLQKQGEHRLLAELRILVENNARLLDPAALEESEYVRAMDRVLGA